MKRIILLAAILATPAHAQRQWTVADYQSRLNAELRQCQSIYDVAISNGCIGNAYVAANPQRQQACYAEASRRKTGCEARAQSGYEAAVRNLERNR